MGDRVDDGDTSVDAENQETLPHTILAPDPPDQCTRDAGQGAYLPLHTVPPCDNDENRLFADHENIDASDARSHVSEPPDDDVIDVPLHDDRQRMNLESLIIGVCLGGGITIIVVALGVGDAVVSMAGRSLRKYGTAVTQRIAQYFRQGLANLVRGTPTVGSLLTYSGVQALCRRPRVIVNPVATVTIRIIINEHIRRRVPVLLLRR